MRLEQLTKAARAAGYVMAVSDDLQATTPADARSEPSCKGETNNWHAGQLKPLKEPERKMPVEGFQWRKGVYHWFGWGATA